MDALAAGDDHAGLGSPEVGPLSKAHRAPSGEIFTLRHSRDHLRELPIPPAPQSIIANGLVVGNSLRARCRHSNLIMSENDAADDECLRLSRHDSCKLAEKRTPQTSPQRILESGAAAGLAEPIKIASAT